MHFTRSLVPALAVAAMCAAEPAPAAAPLVVRAADGAQLIQHWDGSIFAKVWADPSAAPLRGKWTEAQKDAVDNLGFDPLAALAVMKGMQLQFLGMAAEKKPRILAQADFGAFAPKVMALLAKDAGKLAPKQVAGADEALGDDDGVIARFGSVIVAAAGTDPKPAALAGAAAADLAADLDGQRLVDAIAAGIPAEGKAEFDKLVKQMKPYLGIWTYRGDIVAEGIREHVAGTVPSPGVQPADRSVIARLPATTLMALSWGFDGKSYWKAGGEALLNQLDERMHPGAPLGSEATAQEIGASLAGMGVNASLQQVVEGFTGTGLFALTQGAPFPALTLALPRSAATDQLVDVGLKMMGNAAPAEGQSTPIMLPNVPVPITMLCDKMHWVVTSDPMLAATWSSGQPGGFADTPAAKTLFAKAPAHSYLLGASDTPAVLRTVQGFLGLALGANDSLTPEQKQAINNALLRLAGNASTGYVYGAADATHSEMEVRGLIGAGIVPAMAFGAVAAMFKAKEVEAAMPAAADGPDAAVIQRLSGELFPAEIQFQSAAYSDQDGDGLGEYGTMAEIAGLVPAPGRTEKEALFKDYQAGGVIDGFHYAIYLPNGKGAALSADAKARPADKAAADAQERSFVIYAWPDKAGSMFALDQTGVVYEQPFTGTAPAWNALYGGQGWDGVPAWQNANR